MGRRGEVEMRVRGKDGGGGVRVVVFCVCLNCVQTVFVCEVGNTEVLRNREMTVS